MIVLNELLLASANGTEFSLTGFLDHLRLRRMLNGAMAEAVCEEGLVTAAREAGLVVGTAELQRAGDLERYRLGLQNADQTERWLQAEHLSPADWERGLERQLLIKKLNAHLLECEGQAYFEQHCDRYAQVKLRRLVTAGESLAREIASQIREEGCDFAELAQAHSIDSHSRHAGGQIGIVLRRQLSAALADQIFTSAPGDLVGPLVENQGYALYLVEAFLPATYDEATRSIIQQELMTQPSAEKLRSLELHLNWLEHS